MNGKCTATLDSVANGAVVYDICFYPNAKADHTLHFLLELGADTGVTHVYIDVDNRGPIALSLVYPQSTNIIHYEVQSLSTNFIVRVMRFCRHLVELYNPTGEPVFIQKITDKQIVSDFANIGFEFVGSSRKGMS